MKWAALSFVLACGYVLTEHHWLYIGALATAIPAAWWLLRDLSRPEEPVDASPFAPLERKVDR